MSFVHRGFRTKTPCPSKLGTQAGHPTWTQRAFRHDGCTPARIRSMARLPHGARGIDLGDLALEEGKDKLVLIKKSATEHYTLHAGTASGIMDVHRTWTDERGTIQHQTLFSITRDDLIAIIQ